MKKLLLMTFLALPIQTWASGCAWIPEYVVGQKIFTRESEGRLSCRHEHGYESCSYYDGIEKVTRIFLYSEITDSPSLPANAQVKVHVDRYEAMEWFDCDGGDPAPEYKANGNLEKFEIEGKEFISFIND
ncbi:MAG: hypothetical protein V4596_02535 [Bdellovibrionota bacterium]